MVNHPKRSKKTASTTAPVAAIPEHDHDTDYAGLLDAGHRTFARAIKRGPLFETNVENLYETYLDHLDDERQVHTCHSCRHFIERFGGLVVIDADGMATSAMWESTSVPAFYQDMVRRLAVNVNSAKVTGPFIAKGKTLGIPRTGDWAHFAVANPKPFVERMLTAGQVAAAKREDFGTVARALADFAPAAIGEALRIVEAGHLARSERFVAPLQFLADLHASRSRTKDRRVRDNILWLAVATAPEGFCHPRSGMAGSLLEDIAAGLPFADVKARFDSKMHPLQYQRPQAAPAAGNLANAEKIVEKLGIARSLERRHARIDDLLQIEWVPKAREAPARPAGVGVFSHLGPKGAAEVRPLSTPAVTMTWDKFRRTILPGAEAIEVRVEHGADKFIALTTAVHADAPPIIRWDREGARNPVSWYVYHNGSQPSTWGLVPGWKKVVAIAAGPTMWGAVPAPHLGEGYVIVIEGCADQTKGQGNALFPEHLLPELHSVRSTIEAYSRTAPFAPILSGLQYASGLDVRKANGQIGHRLRVTSGGRVNDYKIDRWD